MKEIKFRNWVTEFTDRYIRYRVSDDSDHLTIIGNGWGQGGDRTYNLLYLIDIYIYW